MKDIIKVVKLKANINPIIINMVGIDELHTSSAMLWCVIGLVSLFNYFTFLPILISLNNYTLVIIVNILTN